MDLLRQGIDIVVTRLRSIDWILFVATWPLLGAGWITMNSFVGDNYFANRQLIWIAISVGVFLVASLIDWRFLRRTTVVTILYVVGILLLLSLLVFGSVTKGVQSWIHLGFFSFQPADLMKIILIITLAKYFSRRHIEIAHYRHIVVSGIYAFIPFVLIFMQPDPGSGSIIFLIWLGMIIVSGVSNKHLFAVFGLGIAAALIAWMFLLAPYQQERVLTFIDPLRDVQGAGYNAFQSTVAVGSGQLFGKGVGYGTQSRLEFLPEYQTDFIFAAYAEEWGFIGSVMLFILFAFVVGRILAQALHGATNFETLFAVGVAAMLAAHFIINVGMNMGLLPVTGITLPFLSYGGSHLIVEFLALGMLQGMRRYSRTVHQEDMTNEFEGI